MEQKQIKPTSQLDFQALCFTVQQQSFNRIWNSFFAVQDTWQDKERN